MLRTYSKNISGTANNPIVFNTNKILTNKSVSHSAGSSNISINTPGYYAVTLDSSLTIGTTGTVSLQLFADGVAIPDAIFTINSTAGEYSAATFSTIIKATPGNAGQSVNLTVVPTADITISNIDLGINRLA